MPRKFLASMKNLCKLGKTVGDNDMSKDKELKDQRIPIMMSESEVQALDDWSFNHRIRSRGEAIRRLCQIGLVTDSRADLLYVKFDELLATMQKQSAEMNILFKSLYENNVHVETKELVKASIKALACGMEISMLISDINGQTNNLRDNGNFSEIMKNVTEIEGMFKEDFEAMDELKALIDKGKST